jgi:transcriptional regulator with XRE-family HTH domain
VTNIRALRLSHGLSLVELALLTDISVRTLAEIEYGLQRLDYESRMRLAHVFEIPPNQLWAGVAPAPRTAHKPAWLPLAAPALAAALAGALLLSDPLLNQLPPPSAAARSGSSDSAPAAPPQLAAVATVPTARPTTPATPTATAVPPSPTQPPPTPQPRFVLAEDGPHGARWPLRPAAW